MLCSIYLNKKFIKLPVSLFLAANQQANGPEVEQSSQLTQSSPAKTYVEGSIKNEQKPLVKVKSITTNENKINQIIYKHEKDLTAEETNKYKTFFKCKNKKLESFEEDEKNKNLKFLSYSNRLEKHFKVSLKIAIGKASELEQQFFYKFLKKIHYFLEINQDGSIKNFMLFESSGMNEVDKFFQDTIYSAAPFPQFQNI